VKERKRIRKAGGFISFNGVWRVAGVLATSRALGDFPLKDRNLVIAEPDVLVFELDALDPDFMVLATDGLWDAFTNEEAVAYLRDRLDEPHFGAKSIVLQAYYRGSLDNVTVIVVDFRDRRRARVAVKERKRIKKAGGFISFNGVWRVAGVLATSRALGDFPLKDRNLVIA
ncbi:PREDICTED: protein phosphatase 1L-like, partial [Priapulus caudatus]|uniref:Protein phosphatase 1L-like n=1 Tax=Priapulus caudatus TaxID=37621 RepID=A0ABM1F6S5_PRICU